MEETPRDNQETAGEKLDSHYHNSNVELFNELLKSSQAIAQKLLMATNVPEVNQVYISKYGKNFSIRLNELKNRVSGLDAIFLFFILHEFSNNKYRVELPGMDLSAYKAPLSVFWPKDINIKKYFSLFQRAIPTSPSDLKKRIFIQYCEDLIANINKA